MSDQNFVPSDYVEYYDPIEVREPELPVGAVTLALVESDTDGVLDLVVMDSDVLLASLSESPSGWHVIATGVYLTAGPKRNLEAAVAAALANESVYRRIMAELCSPMYDMPTEKIEVRHG